MLRPVIEKEEQEADTRLREMIGFVTTVQSVSASSKSQFGEGTPVEEMSCFLPRRFAAFNVSFRAVCPPCARRASSRISSFKEQYLVCSAQIPQLLLFPCFFLIECSEALNDYHDGKKWKI